MVMLCSKKIGGDVMFKDANKRLKPCPFCGCEAEITTCYDVYDISCIYCGCEYNARAFKIDTAVETWNDRTIEKHYQDMCLRLEAEKEIYRKHWLDLCDKIIAEIDKDGWCRLSMTREKAMEMKSIFESLA